MAKPQNIYRRLDRRDRKYVGINHYPKPRGKAIGAIVIGIYFLTKEEKGKPTADQIPSAIVFSDDQLTVVDIVSNDPKGDDPYQLLDCQSLVASEDELPNHLQFERNFGKISKDFHLSLPNGKKCCFTIDTSRGEVSNKHYQQDLIQEHALREVFEEGKPLQRPARKSPF